MSAVKQFTPVFVESFPERLEAGNLYVSMEFASVAHLCACGCGAEVVTPLSPTDWKLSFDGVGVTLEPSIGNWRLPCRAHYLVRRNRVVWAGDMSADMIEFGRQQSRRAKNHHYREPSATTETLGPSKQSPGAAPPPANLPPRSDAATPNVNLLGRLRRWFFGAPHSHSDDAVP